MADYDTFMTKEENEYMVAVILKQAKTIIKIYMSIT